MHTSQVQKRDWSLHVPGRGRPARRSECGERGSPGVRVQSNAHHSLAKVLPPGWVAEMQELGRKIQEAIRAPVRARLGRDPAVATMIWTEGVWGRGYLNGAEGVRRAIDDWNRLPVPRVSSQRPTDISGVDLAGTRQIDAFV